MGQISRKVFCNWKVSYIGSNPPPSIPVVFLKVWVGIPEPKNVTVLVMTGDCYWVTGSSKSYNMD